MPNFQLSRNRSAFVTGSSFMMARLPWNCSIHEPQLVTYHVGLRSLAVAMRAISAESSFGAG
jgi:hypothetical protein